MPCLIAHVEQGYQAICFAFSKESKEMVFRLQYGI